MAATPATATSSHTTQQGPSSIFVSDLNGDEMGDGHVQRYFSAKGMGSLSKRWYPFTTQ
ncbi:hypothetical protein M3J09_002448 [Ascochyta lentis]